MCVCVFTCFRAVGRVGRFPKPLKLVLSLRHRMERRHLPPSPTRNKTRPVFGTVPKGLFPLSPRLSLGIDMGLS